MAYFAEKVNITPATPASDVNMFNGNYNFGGGTAVPSYSSTRFKYLGNVLTSILVDNGAGTAAGSFNINANLYYDGTGTFRSRANETCGTLVINGQTTAAGNVMTLFADSSIAGSSGSAVTTVAKFAVNSLGAVTLGDASTNNTLVHQMNGSMNTLGTVIPSFSSTDFRYIGAKTNSILFKGGAVASAGNLNAYGNMYFDGTSGKYARANETCVNLTISGQTTAAGSVYALAADPSVSHSADVAASVVNLHTIDANGLHSIGNSTTNDALVHNIYGSVAHGTVIPSFSSSSFRYVGAKIGSYVQSIVGSGQSYLYTNGYTDGSGDKRAVLNQRVSKLSLDPTASTVFNFQVDTTTGAAGSAAVFSSYFSIDQNANAAFGVPGAVTSTHTFNGLINANTSTLHAFFSSVVGASSSPFAISRSQANAANVVVTSYYFGGTSASSPGTQRGTAQVDAGNTNIGFTYTSDIKLKENIRDYTGALEKVKALATRVFDWKDQSLPKGSVGFIAQEVRDVVPNAAMVITKDENGEDIWGVGQTFLLPIIWAALRELTDKVEKLEAIVSKKKTKKDEE